jgi:antitoxin (DNA-binding transcriptional repressor) of toxin-antitoxin stability system
MNLTITEFRRQCMSLLEDLPEEGLVITRHGHAIARVIPVAEGKKGQPITTTLYPGKGKPGRLVLDLETPYDLVLD